MTFGGLTAYVLTFLLFLPKADPVSITKAFPARSTCLQQMALLADKAEADPNVVDWVVVGDPCTAIHEAHKI